MRITVSSQQLSQATARLQPVLVDRKMGYVGIRATIDRSSPGSTIGTLQLNASDAHMDLYGEMECMVQGEGECFVPARMFTEVTKELPKGEVGLSIEESSLVVRMFQNTQFQMKLPLIDKFSWLEEPLVNYTTTVNIPAQNMYYMTSQVLSCVGANETFIYSEVAYLHRKNHKLRLVASDGARLSYCDMPQELPEGFLEQGVCFGKKALSVMQKIAENSKGDLHLSISNEQDMCYLWVEGFKVYMRLSYTAYPDYTSVLPADNQQVYEVHLSRELFLGTMRRILLATPKIPVITLHFADKNLTISSHNKDFWGKEVMELPIELQEEVSIGLNGSSVLEVLNYFVSETIILTFVDNDSPFVVRSQEEPHQCVSRHVFAPIN